MSEKIQEALRKLRNCSSDLLQASRPTFQNALNTFIDFCETDGTMVTITAPLKQNDGIDVAKAWKEMLDSSNVKLPPEEDQRLSFLYQILIRVRSNESDLVSSGTRVFHDRDIDMMVIHFNDTFSRPLFRGLRDK